MITDVIKENNGITAFAPGVLDEAPGYTPLSQTNADGIPQQIIKIKFTDKFEDDEVILRHLQFDAINVNHVHISVKNPRGFNYTVNVSSFSF